MERYTAAYMQGFDDGRKGRHPRNLYWDGRDRTGYAQGYDTGQQVRKTQEQRK